MVTLLTLSPTLVPMMPDTQPRTVRLGCPTPMAPTAAFHLHETPTQGWPRIDQDGTIYLDLRDGSEYSLVPDDGAPEATRTAIGYIWVGEIDEGGERIRRVLAGSFREVRPDRWVNFELSFYLDWSE